MAYFIANIIGAIIWIILFLIRKDLRKEMVTMSLIAAPFAALDIFFVPSYWEPVTFLNAPVGIEGFIFSFEIGGVAAVFYPELFHKKLVKIKKYHKPLGLLIFLGALSMLIFFNVLKAVNMMIGLYIIFLFGLGFTVYLRKDLLKSALLGGVLFGIIYFISFYLLNILSPIGDWFVLEGLPKIFILDIPLYEILFAILFGAYWGNFYELFFGYRFRTVKH